MSVINIVENSVVRDDYYTEFRCVENITYDNGIEVSEINYYDMETGELANDEFVDEVDGVTEGARRYVCTTEEIFRYMVDAWRLYMCRVRDGFERGLIRVMDENEIIGSEMFVRLVERDYNSYLANARRYERCVASMA